MMKAMIVPWCDEEEWTSGWVRLIATKKSAKDASLGPDASYR
jgi:hypothetical protein